MRKLEALLNPRSIAIVGASKNFAKLNGRPLKFLLDKGYKGAIYPINPAYDHIGELPCYPDVASLPEAPDLAVIAVPAKMVPDSLRDLGEKGAPAAVVFSSGFSEVGPAGAELEEDVRQIVRRYGMALCGPNGLGLINAFEHVMATFSQFANGETSAGPVGFVTQSGAFGTAIAALARERHLGLGYFVNTGNEVGSGFAEIMTDVLADPRIRVGAGYVEGLKDGKAFAELAEHAMGLDKPLVVTKVGKTQAGARAAASHTGSLAGEDAVFDGVCSQFGVIRAADEEHMLDVLDVLSLGVRPDGPRVGLITQSGGAGVLMADKAEELGLEVAPLGKQTTARLKEIVPAFGAVANPVDITAQFIAEPEIFRDSIKTVLGDPNVDVGVVWFQLMHEFVDTLVEVFKDIRQGIDKPLLVCWVAGPKDGIDAVRDLGFSVFRSAGAALTAAAELVRYAERRRNWLGECDVADEPVGERLSFSVSGVVPSLEACEFLRRSGVPMVETQFCASERAAVEAAHRIGYPVVMKVESADVTHKTDVGGIRLGLGDEAAVREAYERIMSDVSRSCPGADLRGVLVQAMDRSEAVEMVIGLQQDAIFGPVVMVGMGGVALEVARDVTFRRAPVSEAEAMRMIDGLRGAPLLGPVRGRPAIDKQALAAMVAAVSRVGIANAGNVAELDINPVRATPDGALAVDWLLVTAAPNNASEHVF
ncbi:acetate--CoA ligase family protein [Billgrantia endophytica]|uniref:acetate--CoA ligase family protein n=1 Tax=Billgrantia endophytica TaxID=2033802 RepID=UPI00197AEF29|nr:acetate--CoA ligase family protein [Halomonas endophytica]